MPAAPCAAYAGRVPISDAPGAALRAHLRRLNRTERAVLMRASVIGRRFRLVVLAAASALSEERLRAVLERFCILQFVVRDGTSNEWYAFRHALIRDVAYEEYVATFLRPVHRLIVRALERSAGSADLLDDLAYHAWAARDVARCLRYNEMAGDRAAAVFATRDAGIYYTRAREFVGVNRAPHRRLTQKLCALRDEPTEGPGSRT